MVCRGSGAERQRPAGRAVGYLFSGDSENTVELVLRGRVDVGAISNEDLAIVAESRARDPGELERIRRDIRSQVLRVTGLGVRHVHLVPPGGIAKTSSGKLARSATRGRYGDELSQRTASS